MPGTLMGGGRKLMGILVVSRLMGFHPFGGGGWLILSFQYF
jgi:hypothetical protein